MWPETHGHLRRVHSSEGGHGQYDSCMLVLSRLVQVGSLKATRRDSWTHRPISGWSLEMFLRHLSKAPNPSNTKTYEINLHWIDLST